MTPDLTLQASQEGWLRLPFDLQYGMKGSVNHQAWVVGRVRRELGLGKPQSAGVFNDFICIDGDFYKTYRAGGEYRASPVYFS